MQDCLDYALSTCNQLHTATGSRIITYTQTIRDATGMHVTYALCAIGYITTSVTHGKPTSTWRAAMRPRRNVRRAEHNRLPSARYPVWGHVQISVWMCEGRYRDVPAKSLAGNVRVRFLGDIPCNLHSLTIWLDNSTTQSLSFSLRLVWTLLNTISQKWAGISPFCLDWKGRCKMENN